MIKREKTEEALLKMGMPAGALGFIYIADAVEIIEKDFDIQIVKGLYSEIAKNCGTSALRVERSIRHAFNVTRERGDAKWVEHYIGLNRTPSASSLKMLTIVLRRESQEERAEEKEVRRAREISLKEIRSIIREELELAFQNFMQEKLGGERA